MNYKEMAITVGLVVVGVIVATIAVTQFNKWHAKKKSSQDQAEVTNQAKPALKDAA
jgi:mannose/fructose/N-acetylgalactosamine-specific phosphotransferase system component IID